MRLPRGSGQIPKGPVIAEVGDEADHPFDAALAWIEGEMRRSAVLIRLRRKAV
jgi:hypothetical protein